MEWRGAATSNDIMTDQHENLTFLLYVDIFNEKTSFFFTKSVIYIDSTKSQDEEFPFINKCKDQSKDQSVYFREIILVGNKCMNI